MGGGNPMKRAIERAVGKAKNPPGVETTTGSLGIGMGQAGQEEEKAKKDKKKSNTLSKKKLGTRGAIVPLHSTQTISGDPATKGVQL